jgi:hypothetical protein
MQIMEWLIEDNICLVSIKKLFTEILEMNIIFYIHTLRLIRLKTTRWNNTKDPIPRYIVETN